MDTTVDYYECDRLTVESIVATIAITDSAFIGPDPHRICLIIPAPLTNRITLAWGEAAVLDLGITLYPTNPPLVLTLKHHGELVRYPIRAITTGGSQVMRAYGSSCHICQASHSQGFSLHSNTQRSTKP